MEDRNSHIHAKNLAVQRVLRLHADGAHQVEFETSSDGNECYSVKYNAKPKALPYRTFLDLVLVMIAAKQRLSKTFPEAALDELVKEIERRAKVDVCLYDKDDKAIKS